MHMDPLLPVFVACAFGILVIGALARRLAQPYVVGYLIAGVLLGPDGLAVFTDVPVLTRVGEIGVIFLLFFVGMEVDLQRLVSGWKVPVLGTTFQIAGSVACVAGIGWLLDWPLARVVLLGFVVSLSSTALVVSMLRQWRELETPVGTEALGILLVQDVAVVVMLIVIGFLGGQQPSALQVGLQVSGGVAIIALIACLARKGRITLPFGSQLRSDHELQVFSAFLLCFGLATLTAFLGLSTALGAFVAGLIVAAARETDWVHRSLEPFRVLFVALFFASVGTLMDVQFLLEHWIALLALTLVAVGMNTLLNASILRALGRGWGTSFYVGALLSQIGEFSFVLASVGKQAGIITEFAYQSAIGVIASSLVLTPIWITIIRPRRGPAARPASPQAV